MTGTTMFNSNFEQRGLVWQRSVLTEGEIAAFRRHGYLHLRAALNPHAISLVQSVVEDMQTWRESPGRWMMYFETPTPSTSYGERMLCRIENFVEYQPELAALIEHSQLKSILAQLMGEPALLFKEKINFKFPGGQGFAPHQDAPAFVAFDQRFHITAMIAIDEATPANGCLEVSDVDTSGTLLAQADDGSIDPATADELSWRPLAAEPGDLLLFDSYLPHRSGPNMSRGPRRALYVTYNRASEGNRRLDYYRDKREKFPPECERIPGRDYSAGAAMYNLANPIRL